MTIAKGSRPFARLSMSGDFSFHDGATNNIPFDVEDVISDSFGEPAFVPGFTGKIFCCQYGLYLVQLQLEVNVSPTHIAAIIFSQSGDLTEQSSQIVGSTALGVINMTANSNHISAESRFVGTPTKFPIIIRLDLTVSGGGDGLVVSSRTKLFIQQLTTYELP